MHVLSQCQLKENMEAIKLPKSTFRTGVGFLVPFQASWSSWTVEYPSCSLSGCRTLGSQWALRLGLHLLRPLGYPKESKRLSMVRQLNSSFKVHCFKLLWTQAKFLHLNALVSSWLLQDSVQREEFTLFRCKNQDRNCIWSLKLHMLPKLNHTVQMASESANRLAACLSQRHENSVSQNIIDKKGRTKFWRKNISLQTLRES